MLFSFKHHARHCDFRRGKKLGIGDHIVTWQRPQQCPQSMSLTEFAAIPATVQVREVHLLVQRPGFRPKQIILVTTLLDPKRYPKAKLAELYHLRWLATEVNFKHLAHYLKHGDDFGKNTRDGMQGHLDTNTCLQFTANLDVGICSSGWRVPLADFLAGHSATFQSIQAHFSSSNCQGTLSALLGPAGSHLRLLSAVASTSRRTQGH